MAIKVAVLFVVLLAGISLADESAALPTTASVGGRELVRNGTAVRSVWGFQVYSVGLFLGKKTGDAAKIMDQDRDPKRVQMHMLRAVDKERFVATIRENIDNNLSGREKETFAAELAAYLGYLQKGGDIEPGRVITIDYLPGTGTVLGLDGRQVGVVPGDDFYHVMLRLWIGRPLQASIKDGLLGADSSDD